MNQDKLNDYEYDFLSYVIKLFLKKPEWTKNDFKNIYNEFQTFLKKSNLDELSLLNNRILYTKRS